MDAGAQLQFLDTSIKTRAESLSGVLQVLTEKRSSIGAVSPSGSEEEKKSHGMEVTGLNNAIQAAAEHLNATVATVKDRELETAAYTQQLIEATGELTEDIFKG
ncbi:MAG: hypothetical protein PVI28_20095 [Gammaproteobacteria bacterium]|jgi:hypothetical protein